MFINIQQPTAPRQAALDENAQDENTQGATTQNVQGMKHITAPLIETYFDSVTNDFVAECTDFGGLLGWGATAQEAHDKVHRDWQRHHRHAE